MNRLDRTTTNRIADPACEVGLMTTAMLTANLAPAAQGEGMSRQRWRFRWLQARLDNDAGEVYRGHSEHARAESPQRSAALADENLRARLFRAGSSYLYREQAAPPRANGSEPKVAKATVALIDRR